MAVNPVKNFSPDNPIIEARETLVQTRMQALGGDVQAQRKLAGELAPAPAPKPPAPTPDGKGTHVNIYA